MAATILIDQDNTLTNFVEATLRYLQYLFGIELKFDLSMVTEYHLLRYMLPNTPEHIRKGMLEEIFSSKDFWLSMKPLPRAIEVVKELYDKYDVYIATSPWVNSKTCILEKTEWVKIHMPFFDANKLIFCHHKELLHADVMIDDSPDYLTNSNCKFTIAFDYPYNRSIETAYRAKNWTEIKKLFSEEEVLKNL